MLKPTEGYTIYSKSGCPNCRRAKDLLRSHGIDPFVVDCDEALLEDRDGLLEYLYGCGAKGTSFPFVFLRGKFLGGYEDTKRHIDTDIDSAFE